MIRLIKLSDKDDSALNSEDILSLHIGYFITYGRVAFSTNIAVATRPEYVLLALGNADDYCYLCHVEDHRYCNETMLPDFSHHSPDKYRIAQKKTWFLLDSMVKIPVDFLDELLRDTTVQDFARSRANNKTIG